MKRKLYELIRYSFAGGACTCVNLLLFVVMERMGMHYLLANTLSYIVAVVINYFLNSHLVFKSASKTRAETAKEFIKFVVVRFMSLGADNGLFYVAVDKLRLNVYASKIVISVVIVIATFVINRVIVFKRDGEETNE